MYGLKQAARQFYKLLVPRLVEIGFEQCLSDLCVIRLMVDVMVTGIVVMHVEYVLFAGGSSVSKIVVKALNYMLPTKHLGKLTWYMGIEFKRD